MRTFIQAAAAAALALSFFSAAPVAAVEILEHGHAHNDYWHAHPLQDALDLGFISVEADVILKDGELLVGHTKNELVAGKTLEAHYLEPLRQRIAENGGSVYPGHDGFMLMIDMKKANAETYAAVRKSLEAYSDILTTVRDGVVEQGPVSIVIGNSAFKLFQDENPRYAFYSVPYYQYDWDFPDNFLIMASDKWSKFFHWKGEGDIPEIQWDMLNKLVERAHALNVPLRLYSTYDKPGPQRDRVWTTLLDAGVDLINTDDIEGLAAFLKARKTQ